MPQYAQVLPSPQKALFTIGILLGCLGGGFMIKVASELFGVYAAGKPPRG